MNKLTWQERFDKEFLDFSYCGNGECMYEGKDKCFHGTENAVKAFIAKEIEASEQRVENMAKFAVVTRAGYERKKALTEAAEVARNIKANYPSDEINALKELVAQSIEALRSDYDAEMKALREGSE